LPGGEPWLAQVWEDVGDLITPRVIVEDGGDGGAVRRLKARTYPVRIGRDHDGDVACFIADMQPFSNVKTTLTRARAADVDRCG
jgi:hypothetical protein